MTRKKRAKKPCWKDVEKRISKFEKTQFTELIRDLYGLSSENKDFFLTRFSIGEDPLATYKKIIQAQFIHILKTVKPWRLKKQMMPSADTVKL